MGKATNHKKRILVVDDETRILNFLTIALKVAGYEVIIATNGQQALQLVESERPHIMLLDIIMPVMDGFEVLKKLRTFSNMPVIVFSAMANTCERAINLGGNDYIIKPFKPDELMTKIEAILNQQGAE